MKQFIYFIIIFFIQTAHSQLILDYDITLIFDSSKNEMFVKDKINSKYPFKMFSFIRAREKEYSYSFHINKRGQLIKGLKGATHWGDYKTSLIHDPKKHSKEIKVKVNLKNPIKHTDYMDVSHKNFIKILKNARKIYMVDISEKSFDDLHYNVYEVHYGYYKFNNSN